jgi:DNA-binding CsgD family transcriptional regulator
MSPRQFEVIALAAQGLSTEQAARLMKVNHETLKSTRRRAIKKLGAANITHAVAIAYERGMLKEVA